MNKLDFIRKPEDIRYRKWRAELKIMSCGYRALIRRFKDEFFMQYTGAQDSNGKDIYEGDIVRLVAEGKKSLHIIKYEKIELRFDFHPVHIGHSSCGCNCGRLDYTLSGALFDNHSCSVDVIGNIFENHELYEEVVKNG